MAVKIYTRVVIDTLSGKVLEEDSFLYDGPITEMKDAPEPPKIPDPANQVRAQASATPSIYTPTGSTVFSGDPTGHDLSNPYRSDVTLSPEQQKLYEGRTAVSQALANSAGAKLQSLPTTFDFDPNNPTSTKFFNAQRKMLDDVFAKDEERLDQKLANQGLPSGSDGNESAADYERKLFERNKADAYEKASADALGQGYNQELSSRQQNLNEVAQALGIQQLNGAGVGGGSGGIDVSGAFANEQAGINRNYQGQIAGYNADTSNTNTGIAAAAAIVAAMI